MSVLPFEVRDVEVRLFLRSTSRNAAALDWFHRTVIDALTATPERFLSPGHAASGAAGLTTRP